MIMVLICANADPYWDLDVKCKKSIFEMTIKQVMFFGGWFA